VWQSVTGWFLLFNFVISAMSVHSWSSAFLLNVHMLCGDIEGRLSHFLPRWLRTGWQNVMSQGEIPWYTPQTLQLNLGHGEDRQRDTFILPLSYHDPGHGEDRQRDSFILPLSYHDWLSKLISDHWSGSTLQVSESKALAVRRGNKTLIRW